MNTKLCYYEYAMVKQQKSIDALFGSKTRVKLLHLFYSNPNTSFYVREITRLVDEQINSVRRELSNMLSVGIILSDTSDNKLYYKVNDRYEYYSAFCMIFADNRSKKTVNKTAHTEAGWRNDLAKIRGVRVAIAAGILVESSASPVDLLIVGSVPDKKLQEIVKAIEKEEGRDINYSAMKYDEFYYRMSVRDKFLSGILSNRHDVVIDSDKILNE